MIEVTTKGLKGFFSSRLCKEHITTLSDMAANSQKLFDELIVVILKGSKHEAFMASWVMGYAEIKKPEWFYSYLPALLNNLEHTHNESVLRSIALVLWKTSVPVQMEGLVTQKCVEWIENKESSIAVKAFSFHILSKIIEREPDLCAEIKDITESVLPYASKGLANSAEKLLKKIKKIGYLTRMARINTY